MKNLTEIARFTDNLPAMTAFYRHLLGVEPAAQSEGMSIFMLGDTKLFLHHMYTPAEGDLPPENHLAFTVPDVNQTCQELVAAGLEIEIPPKEYYWGYSAYLRDPDGQLIELIQADKPE
jgi:catechol 2,3-dioxygenase-like lactoylglutathione lyase family enzyme